MQKRQPRFSDEQKKELAEVHSWVQKGVLPKAINITVRRAAAVPGGGRALRGLAQLTLGVGVGSPVQSPGPVALAHRLLLSLPPQACVDCGSNPASKVTPLYDVEIHDMDLNGMLEPMEEGSGGQGCLPSLPLEVAMEEEEAPQAEAAGHDSG